MIVHLGAVTYEILRRDLPRQEITGDGDRRVVLAGLTHGDFVAQAFDEIRQSAASLPSLARALVETLAGVAADLAEDGIADPGRTAPLARQARLVVAGVEQGSPLAEDLPPLEGAAAALLTST